MKKILITGGAGFIGINAAHDFFQKGWSVFIVDNLSRPGSQINLAWLKSVSKFTFFKSDIRNTGSAETIVKTVRPDVVLHLAAQVAVTKSVINPREDFELNALGTFNYLEAVRKFSKDSFFINASTNKVYGHLPDVRVIERAGRYVYRDLVKGVNEAVPLDFHSPYGCSKGAADQYAIDYSRIYQIRTTSLRQSCIYGPHQFGVEDQGWVAWFTIAACLGRPLIIYGDGKQSRDVLQVGDLVRAYHAAISHSSAAAGQAFNIGGGPKNILGLMELIKLLEKLTSRQIAISYEEVRPGDQKVFVSDNSKARKFLKWEPSVKAQDGVRDLLGWVAQNKKLFVKKTVKA